MSGTDLLILIIDDELPIRRFLRAAVASQGYRLAEAVAGRAGLAQAATLRPDLIILELELPDINGLHLIEQFREWASTPIVVLSAVTVTTILINIPYTDRRPAMYASTIHQRCNGYNGRTI